MDYNVDLAITLIIIMMLIMIGSLGLIYNELRKIEDKIEHKNARPKHKRYWGN